MGSNFTLLYPYYLLLIPLYYAIKYFIKKRFSQDIFSNVKLLKEVSKQSFSIAKFLEFLTIFFITISLATPVKKEFKVVTNQEGLSIAIALDASSSMQEQDRFKIAKEVIKKFLKERKSDEIALILFADNAYVASPLTYDKKSLIKMLEYIKLGVAGSRETALNEALYKSAKLFKNRNGKKILILLSDGIDSTNSITKEQTLKEVKKAGLKIYTIALGKKGDIDINFLKKLAKNSGGRFYLTSEPKNLKSIYQQIDKLQKSKIVTTKTIQYKHLYKFTLTLALISLVALLYFARLSLLSTFITITLILLAIFIPTTNKNIPTKDRANIELNIALDLSQYMLSDDIYPNRLEFEKAKILELLNSLKGEKVALYGFSDRAYLISPATNDYNRLKYALKHINIDSIDNKKLSLLNLLKGVNSTSKSKNLIILSSGGVSKNLSSAIEFANNIKIKPIIYAIGTKTGGAIKINGKLLTNSSGDIEVISLNSALKEFATKTGAKYIKANSNNHLYSYIKKLEKSQIKTKNSNQKLNIYLPLIASLAFLLIATAKRRKI